MKFVRVTDYIYNEAKKLVGEDNKYISWRINTWAALGKNLDKIIDAEISEVKRILEKHTIGVKK